MDNSITITLSQDEFDTITSAFFNAKTHHREMALLLDNDKEHINTIGKIEYLNYKMIKQKIKQQEKPQEVKQ